MILLTIVWKNKKMPGAVAMTTAIWKEEEAWIKFQWEPEQTVRPHLNK
jgi:hypothetical protein